MCKPFVTSAVADSVESVVEVMILGSERCNGMSAMVMVSAATIRCRIVTQLFKVLPTVP